MNTLPLDPVPDLPEGYVARLPEPDDVPAITRLVTEHRQRVRGFGSADEEALTEELVGIGAWMRRHVLVHDKGSGDLVAWARVHDRAMGRTMVWLTVAQGHEVVAPALVDWIADVGAQVGAARGLERTQLDALLDEGDHEQAAWLAAGGYRRTRRWLNMTRRIEPGEEFPPPREGVQVRRVRKHELDDGDAVPVPEDLQAVHRVLEASFADHFNSHPESLAEFAQRLREDPGHRWDHWWLALVPDDSDAAGDWIAGGAVVSSVMGEDDEGRRGSYIDYIGVDRVARGRGVAKALLNTVFADACRRGRNRVGLEVDADSPTGADGLYRAMGFETSYVTESWQREIRTD